MSDYGAVRSCNLYKEWADKKRDRVQREPGKGANSWYTVEFTQSKDAAKAKKNMNLRGVTATLKDPFAVPKSKRRRNDDEVPLRNMNGGVEAPAVEEEDGEKKKNAEQKHRGFLAHHRKYPKTACRIPVLYWWTVLAVAAVMSPVLAYFAASTFSLNVFKVGQVCAWV